MSRYSRYRRYRDDYYHYTTVTERRQQASAQAARLKSQCGDLNPVTIQGRTIAKTFWGKAWCDNIEAYQDYENRLPRGRSYLRSGAVIDLKITTGKVKALVAGTASRPYRIEIDIAPLNKDRWDALKRKCMGKISSIIDLIQGKLSPDILEKFCHPDTGLFPKPQEMHMTCSCPDWSCLCKHLAAVLYAIGARLDQDPKLFFILRGVSECELIGEQALNTLTEGTTPEINTDQLADVFGMDFDSLDDINPTPPTDKTHPQNKTITPKSATKSTAKSTAKSELDGGEKVATASPHSPAIQAAPWTSKRLADLRMRLGLKQKQIASFCHITSALVSMWERDCQPIRETYHPYLTTLEQVQNPVEAAKLCQTQH